MLEVDTSSPNFMTKESDDVFIELTIIMSTGRTGESKFLQVIQTAKQDPKINMPLILRCTYTHAMRNFFNNYMPILFDEGIIPSEADLYQMCEFGNFELVKMICAKGVVPNSRHFDSALRWKFYDIAFWIYYWYEVRGDYTSTHWDEYKSLKFARMDRAATKLQLWVGPNILRINGKKYPHDDPRSLYKILAEKSYNEDYLKTLNTL